MAMTRKGPGRGYQYRHLARLAAVLNLAPGCMKHGRRFLQVCGRLEQDPVPAPGNQEPCERYWCAACPRERCECWGDYSGMLEEALAGDGAQS